MLLYQGLVEYGDGVNLVPCLAKDWTLSADQRTYTFHLRPGVRFSNGREVVASDFVFTLERNLDPKTAALTESFFEGIAGARDFQAGKTPHVRGLRAPRSDTLQIELEQPYPSFLYILTLPGALVVPREAVERSGSSFASHPVGTGPYMLTQWRRGVKMRFESHPFRHLVKHLFSTRWKNQRRQVPVIVPVKTKLAITQRLLGQYWSKTGSQLGSQVKNAGLSASESASRTKTGVKAEENARIIGALAKTGFAACLM